ncbi:glycoside hydrolase family 2 protein [Geofilum sp. OHC36d9]|uniref:glycoside hydrolase family 2 protein n=1 Tax=Geofilum sp. OHC36d9 TaxID=3458413 RepID=UPI00403409B3
MKNIQLLALLLLLVLTPMINAQEAIQNIGSRSTTSLNGKWKYIIDQFETGSIGFKPLWENVKTTNQSDRVEYSFDDAQTLYVPGSWNAQLEKLYYYEGSVWFRKTFDFSPKNINSRVFLYFAGANYKTTVSINGDVIGTHEGGFTPFSFEVTDNIKEKDNFVIVGVSNRRDSTSIPSMSTDWYNYGGLIRDVMIVEVPQNYIDDFTISMNKESLNAKAKVIEGSVKLTGENVAKTAKIEIPELKLFADIPINEGRGTFSLKTKKLDLWSPENPKLYDVVITAGEDTMTDKIGFRTIETRDKEILLNGKPIFLKGVALHDENSLKKDRANTMEDAQRLLGWAKEMGCNFVRLAHYPHQENIVKLADEMGILVWEELPLYWGIKWESEEVLAKAKKQYSEVIRRDKNRAATIIWSIANETPESDERLAFLTAVANHVRALDNTRLLSAACRKDGWEGVDDDTLKVSDRLGEILDVISFNDYIGWYEGSPETCREKSFEIPYNKPVIISEFGGGALAGFHADKETRWSEEYQEYMYEENVKMFNRIDGLAGMTPWVLVDFQSPLRQLPDIQDGWNRKGLISEKGYKKKAFYVMKKFYMNK